MKRIESRIDTTSDAFRRNHAAISAIVTDFRARQEQARHLCPPRDLKRLRSLNKLLPRERLDLLLDPGTPFLEFSSLAACGQYDDQVPGANVITGLGVVSGREVLIQMAKEVAQDLFHRRCRHQLTDIFVEAGAGRDTATGGAPSALSNRSSGFGVGSGSVCLFLFLFHGQ